MTVILCKTKAGKGYKIVINGVWYLTSLKEFYEFIANESNSCKFRAIKNN